MESAHWNDALSIQQWACGIMNEKENPCNRFNSKTLHGIHIRSSIDILENGKLSNGNEGADSDGLEFVSKFRDMCENYKYTTISESGWGCAHIVNMNTSSPGRPSDLSVSILSKKLSFFFLFLTSEHFLDGLDALQKVVSVFHFEFPVRIFPKYMYE